MKPIESHELIMQWLHDKGLGERISWHGWTGRGPPRYAYKIKLGGYSIRIWGNEVKVMGMHVYPMVDLYQPNSFAKLEKYLSLSQTQGQVVQTAETASSAWLEEVEGIYGEDPRLDH
jgi:hypothetical protein